MKKFLFLLILTTGVTFSMEAEPQEERVKKVVMAQKNEEGFYVNPEGEQQEIENVNLLKQNHGKIINVPEDFGKDFCDKELFSSQPYYEIARDLSYFCNNHMRKGVALERYEDKGRARKALPHLQQRVFDIFFKERAGFKSITNDRDFGRQLRDLDKTDFFAPSKIKEKIDFLNKGMFPGQLIVMKNADGQLDYEVVGANDCSIF